MRSFSSHWLVGLIAGLAGAVAVAPAALADPPRRVEIRVDHRGFHPDRVEAEPNEPLVLVFRRTEDRGCGREVVVPSRDIRRELPLNEPVPIEVTAGESGRLLFTCGMGHMRGAVVVRGSR